MEPVIFHADLDAFFASVEQADNPAFKGKPVIVGASPGKRGVVSACSYEARKFGIRSAMPISEAFRRCPSGIFLPVRMNRYIEASRAVMHIMSAYTPSLHQISIDEAFLDITGTKRLFGLPLDVAMKIKNEVRDQLGLCLSIGIARNRFCAKLASQKAKPDGLFEIKPGDEEMFLDSLELHDLWGVGKKTLERLIELNIKTVNGLRSYSREVLSTLLGKGCSEYLYQAVRGIDPGMYPDTPKNRSISSETTFETDRRDITGIKKVLLQLSVDIMFRLLEYGQKSRTVQLKIRFHDFTTCQSQTTLRNPVFSAEEIYRHACALLEKKWDGKTPVRLVGVGLSGVEDGDSHFQPELFQEKSDKSAKMEKAIQAIRTKYHDARITKARLIEKDASSEKPNGKETP
ncbi:MAG: DNA polymerase IV [Spirochaetaceae bacterium]|nr:MAG: DNA polymerase IV [Spirochaetaceae bacterium]